MNEPDGHRKDRTLTDDLKLGDVANDFVSGCENWLRVFGNFCWIVLQSALYFVPVAIGGTLLLRQVYCTVDVRFFTTL